MAANPHKTPPKSHVHEHRYLAAHHSTMERRARLGLPQVGMGGPQVRQDYAQLNSGAGFTLNLLSGMTYGGGSASQCYDVMESLIISLDTGTDVIKKMYIPAFWAEAQVQAQDFLSILAATYITCNLDKLFNTATALFTTEGMSQVSGRVLGAWPFEMTQCRIAYSNKDAFSSTERGYIYGKCLSIIMNYTI